MELPIHIYYATETGNSEDVAFYLYTSLCSKSQGKKREITLNSVKNFQISTLLERDDKIIVLFVVSTCGDGEVPIGMKEMWNIVLRKSLPNTLLSGWKFGVFGLGDSSYEKYNATARKLFVRLKQLGAIPLLDVGLGDDQATYGYFSGFDGWKKSLMQTLFPNPNDVTAGINNEFTAFVDQNIYRVEMPDTSQDLSGSDNVVFTDSGTFVTTVTKNERLTKEDWFQDIRLISLQLPNASERGVYQPGDVAVVHYENPEVWVQKLIAIYSVWFPELQLQDDTVVRILRNTHIPFREHHIPSVECSLSVLFTKYLDICAVPRRSSFLLLAQHASNAEEQTKLLELSAAEGTDLYYDYCVRERRNIVEICEEFRSLRLPLHKLLEIVPLVSGRSYSIASSLSACPQQVELCVSIVAHRTKYGRIRPGLCTSYISTLSVGSQCRISLREGTIRHSLVATQHEKPLILIGPGTGVAPMRAIIQEYMHTLWTKRDLSSSDAPPIVLFSGCRKRTADFIFANEWERMQSTLAGATTTAISTTTDTMTVTTSASSTGQFLLSVIPAFSQDQLIKEYVTHKIKASALTLWRMIKQGACIFVCGSAKRMPKDVKRALVEVITEQTGINANDAEKVLQDMVRAKRYVVEAW